jgi:hypothetical protein
VSASEEGFSPSLPGPTFLSIAMPGSNADDIVGEYFESEDWGALVDPEADPELDTPPTAPESAA